MKNYLDNMNLVDLISEMHKILRNRLTMYGIKIILKK